MESQWQGVGKTKEVEESMTKDQHKSATIDSMKAYTSSSSVNYN